MSVLTDREDVVSMAMTAVYNLMKKHSLLPKHIGRLDVGSESLTDKSKSLKTHLMDLFNPYGNSDIEGITSVNACYGGTFALFTCIDWMHSPSYDGRYGIVVCTDEAIYPKGPARPTGGAGALALLVG